MTVLIASLVRVFTWSCWCTCYSDRECMPELGQVKIYDKKGVFLKFWDTCTLPGTMVQSVHVAYDKWGHKPPYPLNFIQLITANHVKRFKT